METFHYCNEITVLLPNISKSNVLKMDLATFISYWLLVSCVFWRYESPRGRTASGLMGGFLLCVYYSDSWWNWYIISVFYQSMNNFSFCTLCWDASTKYGHKCLCGFAALCFFFLFVFIIYSSRYIIFKIKNCFITENRKSI